MAKGLQTHIDSRLFLEQDLPKLALATSDDFVGGIALWTEKLERKLRKGTLATA